MKNYRACFGILTLLLNAAAPLTAAPGDLDPSFGSNGKVRTSLGGAADFARDFVFQSDNKMVVVGSTQRQENFLTVSDIALVRYLSDGTRDLTFGGGSGEVITRIPNKSGAANAVRVQADGKIVVTGSVQNASALDMIVLRYTPEGLLDPSFGGGDGIVTPFPNVAGAALIVQSDGRIMVNGRRVAIRLLGDGTFDPSFGNGNGIAGLGSDIGGGKSALQADGKFLYPGGVCAGSLFTTCSFAVNRLTADGQLDPTFGLNGEARISLPTLSEFASAVGIQKGNFTGSNPDKIVLVGRAGDDIGIVRLNLNGTPDSSFDGDGQLVLSLSTGPDEARDLTFQSTPSGGATRIFVAGRAQLPATGYDFAVAKLLLSGALDTAFAGDGIAETDLGTDSDDGYDMVLQSGAITVIGEADGDFALVRYNSANGALDPSLSGDGVVVDDIGDLLVGAHAMVIQPDGKIVLAGGTTEGSSQFALARYHEDGTLDLSFSGDGVTLAVEGSAASALALQPDGKLVVVGFSANNSFSDFVLARFLPDGSLDPAFNGDGNADGVIKTPIGTGDDNALAVVLQPDGKILVAGSATTGTQTDLALARYEVNGALDPTFDQDGKVTTAIGDGLDQASAIVLQPDGRIVLAGVSYNGGQSDFVLARYLTNGALDFSFSFDGRVTTPILLGNDGALSATLDGNKIVAAGFAANGAGNDFAVARYNSDGTLDQTFAGDGTTSIEIGAEDIAVAVTLQGSRILLAGLSFTGANDDFALVRLNTNGTLDNSFGNTGRVTFDFPPMGDDFAEAIALDGLGRVVVAGQSAGAFAVARLLGDGTGAPTVMSAVSRKAHGGAGTFDIPLPLTGLPGVECRSGSSHQVIVNFAGPVTMGGFTVSGGGSPGGFSVNGSAATLTVIPDATPAGKRLTITLQNVTVGSATGHVQIPMNLLVGDTNGNGSVTASDIGQTKSFSGQSANAANFRADVNANGAITSSDIGQVKAASGTNLPP